MVLFCGGLGLRMREYSDRVPKPMVPIGYRPILWHLMRYYAYYGHTDFILCLGHQGDVIKQYFLDYSETISNDFVLNGANKEVRLLKTDIENWTMTFVDTGLQANIGERLMAVRDYVAGEECFLANYADGLSDVPLDEVVDLHRSEDAVATFVSVVPHTSFHLVEVGADNHVTSVRDAAQAGVRINGGFFVLDQAIFDHMEPGDELVLEPFERLIKESRLLAFRHDGFWAGMDTFKDRQTLEDLYQSGEAPWQVWDGTG
ncbi:MAG TPA: sugar phosphate nucleotidyltransferase [Acidimicrobiales bacterium]|nr:sugar phosphate nucleotidyltransferase [Acidimicrobiales bacterium]